MFAMEPSDLHHPRNSEGLRRLPHDHDRRDRSYTYGHNFGGTPGKIHGDHGSSNNTHSKQSKEGTRRERIVTKYGPVLLAAGLGFCAGLLFAEHAGKGKAKHQARFDRRSKRDYPASYDGRARLEHRSPDDHFALTRPRAGGLSLSHSSQYARNDDTRNGYWR